jgi:hypothetical protein
MNISNSNMQELSMLMKQTGDEIVEQYLEQFSELLDNFAAVSEFADTFQFPFEAWVGIAQAIADSSGYNVVLQAEILEAVADSEGMRRSVGRLEVATCEPTLFLKEE